MSIGLHWCRLTVQIRFGLRRSTPVQLKYGNFISGIHGEHTESVGGVYDLSNKRRLGITELDAVKEMADGVKAILAKEASL